MSVFFGTDGLRGVVNEDLTYDTAFKCGNSLSQLMQEGRVLIGRDTRVSGSYIVSAISAGLQAGGVCVTDVGVIPTAGVAYLTKELSYNYGIAITASHNPSEYNGIKIFSSIGEKIKDEEEERIERGFIKTKLVLNNKIGTYEKKEHLSKKYFNFLIETTTESFKNYKVVIDASNGAGYKIAPQVFKALGAKVIKVCCKNDGININKKCGALNTQKLSQQVLKHEADFGLAFDGDADRIIVVDEKGEIVNGDLILAVLAKELKRQYGKINGVVGTSQTNIGIEQELKKEGISLFRADVGDKYVMDLMNKHNLNLGGEQSGHIIIKKFLNTGDGILSAIQLISGLTKSKKKMSEYVKIDVYPQVNKNIVVRDKLRILGSEILANAISNVTQELAGRGRVLVRASGTEPKIRIMVESLNQSVSTSLANYLAEVVLKLENSGEYICAE